MTDGRFWRFSGCFLADCGLRVPTVAVLDATAIVVFAGLHIGIFDHFPASPPVRSDATQPPNLLEFIEPIPDAPLGDTCKCPGDLAAAGGRVLPQEGEDAVPNFLAVFWLIQVFWWFSG